ncbi:response regulator [Candidatus Omnitrophota bacterium]
MILVVDDEPDFLEVVSFIIKKMGYEVITAADGREALDLIREKRPDLVFLDLHLPLIDGYEVNRRMKADEALKNIPVIFTTAGRTRAAEEKIKGADADDYLIKPLESEDLLKKIKRFIG